MADLTPIQATNQCAYDLEFFDLRGDSSPVTSGTSASGSSVSATTPVTYKSLGTVVAGATGSIPTLHPSNHIVAMRSGALSDGTVHSRFPVTTITVLSTSKDRSFTVTAADGTAMEDTFRFVRYVSANPDSVIAAQFRTALASKTQDDDVVKFFAGTKSWTTCTLNTFFEIVSWQCEFLSAWQGSYFLYNVSDDTKTVKLVAGVEIKNAAAATTGTIWLADDDGTWTKDSGHADLSISGSQITEANLGSADVTLLLQAVWMNATQTTTVNGKTTSRNVVSPTLSGTVDRLSVVGNFNKITPPATDPKKVAESVFSELQKNAGLLISAGMLFVMFKQWREAKAEKAKEIAEKEANSDKSESEVDEEIDYAEDAIDDARVADMAPRNAWVTADAAQLPAARDALRASEVEMDVRVELDAGEARLNDVLSEAPSSEKTDAVAEALGNARDKVDAGDVSGAWDKLGEVSTNLDALVQTEGARLSQDSIDAANKVRENLDAAKAEAEAEAAEADAREGKGERGADETFDGDDTGAVDPPDMGLPEGE